MTATNPSQDQPGGPTAPVMIPDRPVGAGDRADRIDDTAAELWDALTQARAGYSPGCSPRPRTACSGSTCH